MDQIVTDRLRRKSIDLLFIHSFARQFKISIRSHDIIILDIWWLVSRSTGDRKSTTEIDELLAIIRESALEVLKTQSQKATESAK